MRDVQEMTASNMGLRMMKEEAALKEMPLTQNLSDIDKTLLREDYTIYRNFPGGYKPVSQIHEGSKDTSEQRDYAIWG